MPEHCRHVSMRRVNYELIDNKLKSELIDSKIYKGTDFLILNRQNEWTVAKIEKTPRRGLFWRVTGVKIVSKPDETIYLNDSEVDVLNKNSMAQAAKAYPDKTVIIKGAFEHVSFFKPESVVELLVLEIIPPKPPKLNTLVKNILKIKSFSKPIIISEKIIDIGKMLRSDENSIFVLPCNASGLSADNKVWYLDEFPKINNDERKNITLVGCDLSLRIFKELYEFEPKFINICPTKLAEKYTKSDQVLMKCCKINAFERKGNLFLVPWGVTYSDLENVFKELVKDID